MNFVYFGARVPIRGSDYYRYYDIAQILPLTEGAKKRLQQQGLSHTQDGEKVDYIALTNHSSPDSIDHAGPFHNSVYGNCLAQVDTLKDLTVNLPHRGPAYWDDGTQPMKKYNRDLGSIINGLQNQVDDAFANLERLNTQKELEAFHKRVRKQVRRLLDQFKPLMARHVKAFDEIAKKHGWHKVSTAGGRLEWDGPDPLRKM